MDNSGSLGHSVDDYCYQRNLGGLCKLNGKEEGVYFQSPPPPFTFFITPLIPLFPLLLLLETNKPDANR